MGKHFQTLIALAIVSLVMVVGLSSMTSHAAVASHPGFQRSRSPGAAGRIAIPSDQQEVAMGQDIDAQLKQEGLPIYSGNTDVIAYVNAIGQRLAQYSDRPTLPYTFQVVNDDSINAFATMGGFVYINTGLIEAASNEAELAGVIAHEIGHIGGRHTLKAMLHEAIGQRIGQRGSRARRQQINRIIELRQLSYSREDEYDADERGYHTLGKAGYTSEGYITFMAELDAMTTNQPEFLSTHPDPGNRVDRLTDLAASYPYPNANDGLDSAAYQAKTAGL